MPARTASYVLKFVRRLLQTAFVRKPSQTGLGLHYTPPLLLWCIYLVDSFGSGF